ncbi:MAG: ChbG/HpnK family deacetylase [Rhodoferax sp.]|uniref:ChbG/HpnK family deacetylase n=1 Tax=Rhodoferax sp. TaxID=50421 RepID=UPI0032675E2B
MARTLAVCSDDFGLTLGISQAISELAHAGRITMVSCMPQAPAWRASLPLLAQLPAGVQRGLHFNLTEGAPLSTELRRVWPQFLPLPRLILAAHLRQLPLAALAAEWAAQWQAFANATGAAPDFVDGHQHVHHLPGVRGVLLEAIAALPSVPAVRNTGHLTGPGFGVKRWLIEGTGGWALQRALVQRGIRHNPSLTGAYDFIDPDYGRQMRGWLAALPATGGLLFCHPGYREDAPTVADPIAPARVRELAYLGSEAFLHDLQAADVVLGSVW